MSLIALERPHSIQEEEWEVIEQSGPGQGLVRPRPDSVGRSDHERRGFLTRCRDSCIPISVQTLHSGALITEDPFRLCVSRASPVRHSEVHGLNSINGTRLARFVALSDADAISRGATTDTRSVSTKCIVLSDRTSAPTPDLRVISRQ